MPSLGLNLALPEEQGVGEGLVSPGVGALLMETSDFFLLEDGTSHFIFE